ncbi:MAG: NAD-dependent epimerase/dehydratase family protein [Eubacterium sp.]|nr:NAD-dependent epimerase/dehydratase family protein [Eubacterium sp.]
MKKVLITGANSFIGMSVEKHMMNSENEYEIDTIDMIDGTWKNFDFSSFDSVFHVAGIAHSEVGNATEEQKAMYYKINTELAYETAQKAKNDGVKQFIFMSSAIVFGASAPVGVSKVVSKDTPTNPENFYGDSKVQAEIKLNTLRDDSFKVCIIRPPMIYGPGSRGNYPLLSKFAKKLPVFPNIENCRSMIYIENFAEFVRLMIENQEDGMFMPQNNKYTCTSTMVKEIAKVSGKNIILTKLFNPVLKIMGKKFEVVNKAFGNLAYDMEASAYKENYCICDWDESIRRTEAYEQ